MKRFGLILGLVMISLVFVDEGWAGPKHYVASYGLDSNPCTLNSPCRSFAHAVDVTDAGGEVIVLDTGGYGSVTITKSISIIVPVGIYASITVPSGAYGIIIKAGANDQVLIKGLTIKGTSGSYDGILTNKVGTLIVDNCFISGFDSCGIYSQAPNSELVILNSKINNNSNYGVRISNTLGSVSLSMKKVEMVNNYTGLLILAYDTGSISATVTNSMAKHNLAGFHNLTYSTSSGTTKLNLEHCIISGNEYGILTNNDSTTDITRLSNCTVTGNVYGIYKDIGSLGTIYTQWNNRVVGNVINSSVSPTTFSAW